MTTINSNAAYNASILYGLTTAKTGTDSASGTASQTTSTDATAASIPGASDLLSLADAVAAARNSASYSFTTVGSNARTVLDAGLKSYGQTPSDQTTTKQWTDIFGGMDRRSLFAVASNQGGQFTPQEQQVAKQMMNTQLTDAATTDNSSANPQATGLSQQINLLDNASAEEKQTATWAYSMANAKTSLNMLDFDSRMPAATTSSSNSLVNVLMGAMRNAQSQSTTALNFGSVDTLGQITSQSWARDYASQIEAAFSASYLPGTGLNISA